MYLEIISPDQNIYEGEVHSGVFPGSDGSFGILEGHAPMVATLKEGQIKVVEKDGEQLFDIKGGVLEVNHNKVIVLAD